MSKIDVISAVRFYIDKIVSDPTIGGMKALVLDNMTTKIVSMVYSQTQILEQSVYLVELLGNQHEPMLHLKAALFIRPTEANLTLLLNELLNPKFSEYHIYFSNVVPTDVLTRLAKADVNEVVKQVHEYYADFVPVNEDFFQLGVTGSLSLSSPIRNLKTDQIFERNLNGLLSVLLATKRKPCQVRYQSNSEVARRIANDVVTHMEGDGIYMFQTPGPILLILDRRDDPITPLLTQWTYQAMVHELLGLNYNRVILKSVPNIKKDLEEVVLSCTQDSFFAKNRYSNFGDIGEAVKELLGEYQKEVKLNEKINSIEDMQNLMTRFPAFRSKGIIVSKHVAIMGELARLTESCRLLDISQLEQEMSCSTDHTEHKKMLIDFIQLPKIQLSDKLRLAIIFLLKYESYGEMNEMRSRLSEVGVPNSELSKLQAIINYAGENQRATGLFSGGEGNLVGQFRKALVNLNGVENVYTQHKPLLSSTLEYFAKNRQLKDASYPNVMNLTGNKPTEMIVFIVGGVTFEEATKVAEFNSNYQGVKVTLGGSYIHNSNSFLKEIASTFT